MAQERILIVDGDLFMLEMLTARLEAQGYLVTCARTGSSTLDILKNMWVDLILLEVILPGGISGFHLFKEIKKMKRFSKIPIVMQSSKAGMKQIFRKMGAEAFLIKPYSVDTLLDVIRDILER